MCLSQGRWVCYLASEERLNCSLAHGGAVYSAHRFLLELLGDGGNCAVSAWRAPSIHPLLLVGFVVKSIPISSASPPRCFAQPRSSHLRLLEIRPPPLVTPVQLPSAGVENKSRA